MTLSYQKRAVLVRLANSAVHWQTVTVTIQLFCPPSYTTISVQPPPNKLFIFVDLIPELSGSTGMDSSV